MIRTILLCVMTQICMAIWAQETECRPMLAGNPVWVYQQNYFSKDWFQNPSLEPVQKTYYYVFLHGTEMHNGREYQVAWIIDSNHIKEPFTVGMMEKTLLVREEDGRVFSPFEDSFIGYAEDRLGIGGYGSYDIIDDEIVTNNFTLEVGVRNDNYPQVVNVGTLMCEDGKERRTWTFNTGQIVAEQIGLINEMNFPLPFDPFVDRWECDHIKEDEYFCVLNSMYSDGELLFKAPTEYSPTWIWGAKEGWREDYMSICMESFIYSEPPHLQQVLDFIATLPADAISTPSADKRQETPIYDLLGRRLSSEPRKGMYIQGGKKVVNK